MSKTKNTPNNNPFKVNITQRYVWIILFIEYQLDNKANGITIAVNNTKYIDIPSTPILNPKYSSVEYEINWNELLEKSDNAQAINITTKFNTPNKTFLFTAKKFIIISDIIVIYLYLYYYLNQYYK